MQPSKKGAPKRPSRKLFLVVGVLVVLVAVIIWALYAFNRPNDSKTGPLAQTATVLTVNEALQQNDATQICSAGHAGPGGLTASSTNIVYEVNKNRADTAALLKKVSADNGYGTLGYTTNGSADFYEGNNKSTATTISFVVYGDRKYTTCAPTPSTDPNLTAFMLSVTPTK